MRCSRRLGGILAVALGVASCSGPTGTAAAAAGPLALARASRHALGSAASFTANGLVSAPGARFGFFVRSTDHGSEATGTLTSNSARLAGFSGRWSFVRLGSALYVSGDESFWAGILGAGSSPAQADSMVGTWFSVAGPGTQLLMAETGALSNPDRINALITLSRVGGPFSFGPTRAVGAHEVVSVRSATEDLEVATNGAPLPLALTTSSRLGTRMHIAFTYPASLVIRAPARTLPLD